MAQNTEITLFSLSWHGKTAPKCWRKDWAQGTHRPPRSRGCGLQRQSWGRNWKQGGGLCWQSCWMWLPVIFWWQIQSHCSFYSKLHPRAAGKCIFIAQNASWMLKTTRGGWWALSRQDSSIQQYPNKSTFNLHLSYLVNLPEIISRFSWINKLSLWKNIY